MSNFEYTPKTEQQLKSQNLLSEGLASFKVESAKEMISRNGNHQIQLVLNVVDSNGKKGKIWDYLIATEKWDFKIRHFCYSCGLGEMYDSGRFGSAVALNKEGKLIISMSKDMKGGPMNAVKDYVSKEDVGFQVPSNHQERSNLDDKKPVEQKPDFDDDIPF